MTTEEYIYIIILVLNSLCFIGIVIFNYLSSVNNTKLFGKLLENLMKAELDILAIKTTIQALLHSLKTKHIIDDNFIDEWGEYNRKNRRPGVKDE